MRTAFKTAVALAMGGLCGCAAANDEATPDQASLSKDSEASTLVGVPQGYRGDFNNDGIDDIIVVTASGTNEYLGLVNGGFSASKWSRTDLTLTGVIFTVGDFNKDGFSDIIITTAARGSNEWLGKSGGGFTFSGWSRPDLTLNNVVFHAGDFSGDGATDLFVTTAQGSFEYLGVPGGTFSSNSVWSANWPLNAYDFKVGDFNNDTRSDLIVTNTSGSYEFPATLGGGFYQAVWPGGLNFLLGSLIVPGDYNGDKSWDLLAQNNTAAYELHGHSGVDGGFTDSVWTHTEFSTLQRVNLTSGGDFNGDGKWDAIISTGDTSYLYLGQANNAGFTPSSWQAPLPSYSTGFYVGQFRGKPTADLIVSTPTTPQMQGSSSEYLGLTTGGFSTGAWVRTDLALGNVLYF